MFLECIGSIGYWEKFIQKPSPFNLNHTFQKQSALSQFSICGPNGLIKLSIPTKKATRRGPYSKVEIDYSSKWQSEHWKSIENAYIKSPFFIYYDYKIEPIFKKQYRYLCDFNIAMTLAVKNVLRLNEIGEITQGDAIFYDELASDFTRVYPQVYDDKNDFIPNLSILDLLFNLGPETLDYLAS